MHIKHYTQVPQRVADPLRPGRTVNTPRLIDSQAGSLGHEGETYEPDENGWFEVPHDVGEKLCKFRVGGSGYFTPGEVADAVRLGSAEGDQPTPAKKQPRRPDAQTS